MCDRRPKTQQPEIWPVGRTIGRSWKERLARICNLNGTVSMEADVEKFN